MTGATRHTRRYVIAFLLSDDLGAVSEYQPTRRGRVPVYRWDGAGDYFVALRPGEAAPPGVAQRWEPLGEAYGYRVLRGRV